MALEHQALSKRQSTIRYNWGFRFAIWCALLWGFSFQGIGMLFDGSSFLASAQVATNPLIMGAMVALFISILVALIAFIWMVLGGSFAEWRYAICRFNRLNLLYLLCATLGGGATVASIIIANLLGVTFAVGMVIFYPVIGALIANLWYNEKISRRALCGLLVIVAGCACLYVPDMLAFLTDADKHPPLPVGNLPSGGLSTQALAFHDPSATSPISLIAPVARNGNPLLICCLGVLVGIGWGAESALASRAMDFTNARVGVSIRFTYEAIIMVLICLVCVLFLKSSLPLVSTWTTILTHSRTLLLMAIIALCLVLNYFSWYQSLLFCGVCRGTAVSDISGFVTVVLGMLLMLSNPSLLTIVACMLMLLGVYLVYCGQSANLSVLRNVDLMPIEKPLKLLGNPPVLGVKSLALGLIATNGGAWDQELLAYMKGACHANAPSSALAPSAAASALLLAASAPPAATPAPPAATPAPPAATPAPPAATPAPPAAPPSTHHKKLRHNLQLALIELTAAGLIVAVDDTLDKQAGDHQETLHVRYQLTGFGQTRLKQLLWLDA